jgi:hypothetical protein
MVETKNPLLVKQMRESPNRLPRGIKTHPRMNPVAAVDVDDVAVAADDDRKKSRGRSPKVLCRPIKRNRKRISMRRSLLAIGIATRSTRTIGVDVLVEMNPGVPAAWTTTMMMIGRMTGTGETE